MKRRSRNRSVRVQRADEAISHLSSILADFRVDTEIRNSAAKDLFRTCTRHNRPIPNHLKNWICRGCKDLLIPGETARIRIREKVRITTCLSCNREKRRPLDLEVKN
jgi:RNase P subunit RPR2